MDFDEYQTTAKRTDSVPLEGDEKLHFLLLGLTDELGQIAGLVKKFMRHDIAALTKRNDVVSRLGDALWYMALIADHMGTSLSNVAEHNLRFFWKGGGFQIPRACFTHVENFFPTRARSFLAN
jgi:NTP pyrophosphatase (non-canonical NTP hydrolase)